MLFLGMSFFGKRKHCPASLLLPPRSLSWPCIGLRHLWFENHWEPLLGEETCRDSAGALWDAATAECGLKTFQGTAKGGDCLAQDEKPVDK